MRQGGHDGAEQKKCGASAASPARRDSGFGWRPGSKENFKKLIGAPKD
jgi:hypothetical protein